MSMPFPFPGRAESTRTSATRSRHRFYARHLAWPLLGFAVAATAIALFDGDRSWADRLYAWQGNAWTLKSTFVADTVIHDWGHLISVAAWLGVLATWIVAVKRTQLAAWRRPLCYLALATLTATLLVGWMKSWTNMDCPWDVLDYGGNRPYHGLFDPRPANIRGQCFPAGHASAGYCWLALYFFFIATRPRLRWVGLFVALGLGLLLGVTQQLRGAHFLSHDLWSLTLCWLIALGWYALMFGTQAPDIAGEA